MNMTCCQRIQNNWRLLDNLQRFLIITKILITILALVDLIVNIIDVVQFLTAPLDYYIQHQTDGFYVISKAYSDSTADRTLCHFYNTTSNSKSNLQSPNTTKTALGDSDVSDIFNNNGLKIFYAVFDILWLTLSVVILVADLLNKKFPFCCWDFSHKQNYLAVLGMSLITLPTRGLVVGYGIKGNCLEYSPLINMISPSAYVALTFVALGVTIILVISELFCCKGSINCECNSDEKTKTWLQLILVTIFALDVVFAFLTIIANWVVTPLAFDIINVIIIFLEVVVVCKQPEHQNHNQNPRNGNEGGRQSNNNINVQNNI